MKFKPVPRKLIIRFKNLWNDEVDGIKIDVSFKPEHHIRIDAEVVGVPNRFEGDIVCQHYEGSPSPKNYSAKRKDYQLYHHQSVFYDVSHADIDIQIGDKVYFHYLAVDYEQFDRESRTYLYRDAKGYEYHQIPVEMVFCTVRDGVFNMLMGKVFVEPIVKEKENLSGFIVPESKKYLEGIIKHIGKGMPSEERDITVNDKIIFLKSSEFENEIEGTNYYVMKQWFIAAKMIEGIYKPVGKMIKIGNVGNSHDLKLSAKHTPTQLEGIVDSMGENCDNDLVGERVVFNNRSAYFVKYDESHIFVREEDIYYIKNGASRTTG